MQDSELRPLLQRARVLGHYAIANGRVESGSRILQLLSTMPAHGGGPGGALAELAKEMAALTGDIDPIRVRWWAWREAVATRWPAIALGVFTMLLTSYVAFQSSQLHQANMALRAYEEWQAEHPKEKIFTAFKAYRYERALKVQAPPLAQLDAYQKNMEDSLQLANKEAAILRLLHETSQLLRVPALLTELHSRPEEGAVAGPEALYARIPTDLPRADCVKFVLKAGSSQPATKPPDCDESRVRAAIVSLPDGTGKGGAAEVARYRDDWEAFLKELGIDPTSFAYPPWMVIYAARFKVNMLATWLLPALYGMLGASVFLMRDMMRRRPERATAEGTLLMSVLLRLPLGALAGLIVGWFPLYGSPAAGVPETVSSIPFGIAFLAGFSIEGMFARLDAINRRAPSAGAKPP